MTPTEKALLGVARCPDCGEFMVRRSEDWPWHCEHPDGQRWVERPILTRRGARKVIRHTNPNALFSDSHSVRHCEYVDCGGVLTEDHPELRCGDDTDPAPAGC